MYEVSAVACESYNPAVCRKALEEAVNAAGGLGFVKRGETVVIKVNLVSAMKPERAATTHPALVCALVDMLKEIGAEIIIGDSPGGVYSSAFVNRAYNVSGMHEAEKHGAVLNEDFGQTEAEFPGAKVAKEFYYTSYLDKADHIIDFCKLKSHGMMSMSCGAKNMFGVVPGITKPEYHYKYSSPEDFAAMIIDLNDYFKPELTVCDAVEGMEGNGPTAGTPRFVGCVLAAKSAHKLDLACAELIGYGKDDILTLREAYARGYIPERADMLDIYGDLASFAVSDYKKVTTNKSFKFNSDSKSFIGRYAGKVVSLALSSKPDVKAEECIGCAECFRVCPAKAITMVNKKPDIDRSKCIKCFCCQEFCPKGAMKVKRTPIAKVFTRLGSRK